MNYNFANQFKFLFSYIFVPNLFKIYKSFFCKILLLFMLFVSFSCSKGKLDAFDTKSNLSISDIEKSMIKAKKDSASKDKIQQQIQSSIPKLNKSIITPPPPIIGGDILMSVYINSANPVIDALVDIGRAANIDVDIDSAVNNSGGVIINANNRPLKEIIDRICAQANLRYSYKNKVLFFESDKSFLKNYYSDFLPDSPLWDEIKTNLDNILIAEAPKSNFTTSSDPLESSSSSSSSSSQVNGSVVANKNSGFFTIYANTRQHLAIEKYLNEVNKQASAQVLIEAKIVEVSLKDSFSAGIDWGHKSWSAISGASGGIANSNVTSNFSKINPKTDTGFSYIPGKTVKIFGLGPDINLAVKALSTFGVTKAVSSPRINAINNQKSTLTFANKLVYFKIEQTAGTVGTLATPGTGNVLNSTKQEESVGVILNLTPSINLKTNEVTISIEPKFTTSNQKVQDPVNEKNLIPVIVTRELKTIAKIQSGNVLVLGGLMEDSSTNSQTGVPFVSKIPVLGWFFKFVNRSSDIKETVIFIKATIIHSSSQANSVDRELQEKYDVNRREYF